MSALAIIYSPAGDVLSVPRDRVTALVVTYDPPRRTRRVAPPSLRPIRMTTLDAGEVARLLDQLPR